MKAAIVDCGMGNLFSVQRACARVGLETSITSDRAEVLSADGVVLPGVGAFGDAMEALRREGLTEALKDVAASGKPLMGVCLGMQLLMSESAEFGRHEGLGILEGDVVRFDRPTEGGRALKVPQVGWNRVFRPEGASWAGTPLEGTSDGEYMYFVHSFHVRPADPRVRLAASRYGDFDFCSALGRGNLFACQFHPERSGPSGLEIYRAFARKVTGAAPEATDVRKD